VPAWRVLAEIDRFVWHARKPFDDAQLAAFSKLYSSAVDSDAGTRARRLRFVAPQHLLFAARTASNRCRPPSVPPHAVVVGNLKSQPVRPQFNVTDEALARQLVTPPPP
jgi:hypothetical protein